MKILGLDLGTHTGYAYNGAENRFHCGTWVLATDAELRGARKQRLNRRLDLRVTELFQKVQALQAQHGFGVISFEDILFTSYTLQVQLWASLRAAMWTGAFHTKPVFDAVPVATLKKFATGHGNATKEAMIAALIKNDPRFTKHEDPLWAWFDKTQEIDDNACDAIWLWRRAKQLFNR